MNRAGKVQVLFAVDLSLRTGKLWCRTWTMNEEWEVIWDQISSSDVGKDPSSYPCSGWGTNLDLAGNRCNEEEENNLISQIPLDSPSLSKASNVTVS